MINKLLYLIDLKCSGDKIQFCLETKIKRDLLYSILSGRNKNPGINTITQIKNAYPNINLNWLLSNDPIIDYIENLLLQKKIKRFEKEIKNKDELIEILRNNNF